VAEGGFSVVRQNRLGCLSPGTVDFIDIASFYLYKNSSHLNSLSMGEYFPHFLD
jgi:hypothetical protein